MPNAVHPQNTRSYHSSLSVELPTFPLLAATQYWALNRKKKKSSFIFKNMCCSCTDVGLLEFLWSHWHSAWHEILNLLEWISTGVNRDRKMEEEKQTKNQCSHSLKLPSDKAEFVKSVNGTAIQLCNRHSSNSKNNNRSFRFYKVRYTLYTMVQ